MYPNAILGFIHLYGLMIGIGIISAFGVLSFFRREISKFGTSCLSNAAV